MLLATVLVGCRWPFPSDPTERPGASGPPLPAATQAVTPHATPPLNPTPEIPPPID
jgi:hypothetical protein